VDVDSDATGAAAAAVRAVCAAVDVFATGGAFAVDAAELAAVSLHAVVLGPL
jgi:hypothetical protein